MDPLSGSSKVLWPKSSLRFPLFTDKCGFWGKKEPDAAGSCVVNQISVLVLLILMSPQRWGPGQCHQKQQAESSLIKSESSAQAVRDKLNPVLKAEEVSHLLVLSRLSLQRLISCSIRLQTLCHRSSRAPPTSKAVNPGSTCNPES